LVVESLCLCPLSSFSFSFPSYVISFPGAFSRPQIFPPVPHAVSSPLYTERLARGVLPTLLFFSPPSSGLGGPLCWPAKRFGGYVCGGLMGDPVEGKGRGDNINTGEELSL
jgi:hypothetical protein